MTDESLLWDFVDLREVESELFDAVSLRVRESTVDWSNDFDPDSVTVEILVFLPSDRVSPLRDSGVPKSIGILSDLVYVAVLGDGIVAGREVRTLVEPVEDALDGVLSGSGVVVDYELARVRSWS